MSDIAFKGTPSRKYRRGKLCRVPREVLYPDGSKWTEASRHEVPFTEISSIRMKKLPTLEPAEPEYHTDV